MKLNWIPGLLAIVLVLSACNSTDGGVKITDLITGDGVEAAFGNEVSVHYTGWIYAPDSTGGKGLQFDSSVDRGAELKLILGFRQVIEGWDIGLEGMKVGGKRELVIPAELAFGEQAVGSIPPNSALLFEVELFDVVDLAADVLTEDLQVGDGAEALPGMLVKLDYTGWVMNPDSTDSKGLEFDSNVNSGRTLDFPIARSRVIPGLDMGLIGMKVGGKRRITIPPYLGYRSQAIGAIPPNSTLIFDIELFDVIDPASIKTPDETGQEAAPAE